MSTMSTFFISGSGEPRPSRSITSLQHHFLTFRCFRFEPLKFLISLRVLTLLPLSPDSGQKGFFQAPVSHGRKAQFLSRHLHASRGRQVEDGLPHRARGQHCSFDLKGREEIKGLCQHKEQLCLGDRHQATAKNSWTLMRKGEQSSPHAALEGSSTCKDKTQPCTDQPPEVLRSRGLSRDRLSPHLCILWSLLLSNSARKATPVPKK